MSSALYTRIWFCVNYLSIFYTSWSHCSVLYSCNWYREIFFVQKKVPELDKFISLLSWWSFQHLGKRVILQFTTLLQICWQTGQLEFYCRNLLQNYIIYIKIFLLLKNKIPCFHHFISRRGQVERFSDLQFWYKFEQCLPSIITNYNFEMMSILKTGKYIRKSFCREGRGWKVAFLLAILTTAIQLLR